MGVKTGETKHLGASRSKTVHTIEVAFPAPIVKVTKREILRKIAKIYDRSGLGSPVTLAGKMLYRETCDARLIRNCRAKHQQRITRPITTQEICRQKKFWEKGTQVRCQGTARFQDDQQRLNLQKNTDGLYKCRGRIQGYYPIYLPDDTLFSKRLYCASTFRLSMGESV